MWCSSADAKLVLVHCTPLTECIEWGVCSCSVFNVWFCVQNYYFTCTVNLGRLCGMIVSVLYSRSTSPGSSLARGHCVVFLGKTLNSHSVSIHPGAQMGTSKFRVTLQLTSIPSRGSRKLLILLVTSRIGVNHRPYLPLGSNRDFVIAHRFNACFCFLF